METKQLEQLIANGNKPLAPLADARSEKKPASVKFQQRLVEKLPGQVALLIVAERRDFVRGCLACWLGNACGEFTIFAVPDIETSLTEDLFAKASVALVGVDASEDDAWLISQLTCLRERSASLPIVVLLEAEETDAVAGLVNRFGIRGIIPSSSNMNVAAAALRLVMAGGRYFPDERPQASQPTSRPVRHSTSVAGRAAIAKLTPREEAVPACWGMALKTRLLPIASGCPSAP